MGFIDNIKARARKDIKKIVLPESEDRRVLEAAARTLEEGNAEVVLIGDAAQIAGRSEGLDLSKAEIVDPAQFAKLPAYIAKLTELRKEKGMTEELARETLVNDYTTFGVMMVKMGDAHGLVSGACHSTANTLRPCLQILKTAEGVKSVSTFFVMVVPDCVYGEEGIFVFGDCGLIQNPSAQELAEIAVSSAKSYRMLIDKEPRVALLSHSSMGSAKHADVDKVAQAVKLAKEAAPEFAIDGELQLDAAIVPSIAAAKAPESKVAGKANVLIFPDLDSGNIGYKLVERLAKAEAYGPMTQGIAKPVNDLSRGCSVEDIVGVIAITSVQCTAL